jgi:hypothetical protein
VLPATKYPRLTPAQAALMRALYRRCSEWDSPYGWTPKRLAARFLCTESAVQQVLGGGRIVRRWRG